MAPILTARGTRPKSRKAKKFLENRAPKVHENDKTTLIVHGGKTGPIVDDVLDYFNMMKKPHGIHMKRHNQFHLFEDPSGIEKFSSKFDASLFVFGSNQKKRPHALTFGRMFDHQILDMFEMKITKYIPAEDFKQPAPTVGSKPCIMLQGSLFESDDDMKRLGSLMVDWFKGVRADNVRLQGLENIISLTLVENRLLFRVYRTVLKTSATQTPRVELVEAGPSINFQLDRKKIASDSLYKQAMRQPAELRVKPRKNVSRDVFGTQKARIHLGRQRIDNIQTRKVKALRHRSATGGNTAPLGSRGALSE